MHDVRFDTQLTPSVDELFSQSLGAFIGEKKKVVLRYTKNISHYISYIIDCVDPKIKNSVIRNLMNLRRRLRFRMICICGNNFSPAANMLKLFRLYR